MDIWKAFTQAYRALDSFKMQQSALPLSAGCVESGAEEVGIETAFFGRVGLLVTSYWQGWSCVRAVPPFKFAFLDSVFLSQIFRYP